jgi:Protein of unknown function (DUF3299)
MAVLEMRTEERDQVAMNQIEQNTLEYESEAPELRYRAVSGMAVFSLVLSVLSLPCLVLPAEIGVLFMGGAFMAFVLGVIAIRTIRMRPDEYLGGSVAWTGALVGITTLVVSVGWGLYVTATEVPEGYTRVSFGELQQNRKNPELPFAKRALELDGKRVYIKGYTASGDQKYGLKKFLLVKDLGTCCFGGEPNPTHMMNVTFSNNLTVDYGYSQRGVGGILHVDKQPRLGKLGGVYFRLEADHLR